MPGQTGSFPEFPQGEGPFARRYRTQCPDCGRNMSFGILLDLYRISCPGCGKIPILYFWGKKEGPHLTEDLALMLCEEHLLTENLMNSALQTKKQSGQEPFIELLLSIQYVTSSELNQLARRLAPDEWVEGISDVSEESPELFGGPSRRHLSRQSVDAIFLLIDQILSGEGFPFSRVGSAHMEVIVRSLGADLTTGEIRTRLGKLLLEPSFQRAEMDESNFAHLFSELFDLDYISDVTNPSPPSDLSGKQAADLQVFPLQKKDGILHVAVPGHLQAFGLGSLFDIPTTEEIRGQVRAPVSFVIMPASAIDRLIEEAYGETTEMDPDQVGNLLDTLQEEVSDELRERYNALSDTPEEGLIENTENPVDIIRDIFRTSTPASGEREVATSPVHPDTINRWLYHPERELILPDFLDGDVLDQLCVWVENQYRKSDQNIPVSPSIPEEEKKEVRRLHRAMKQVSRDGGVNPVSLDIPGNLLNRMDPATARIFDIVPIARAAGTLWVCRSSLEDTDQRLDISFSAGQPVRIMKGQPEGISEMLVRVYGRQPSGVEEEEPEPELELGAPIESVQEAVSSGPEPADNATAALPEQVMKRLRVVPVEIGPGHITLACDQKPSFLEREFLHVVTDRALQFTQVSEEELKDLLNRVLPAGGDMDNESMLAGLMMDQPTLDLSEVKGGENVLSDLETAIERAPRVRIYTDPEDMIREPLIKKVDGQLKLKRSQVQSISPDDWPPALGRLLPAVPIRKREGEITLVSSALDQKFVLNTSGLFLGTNVNIYIMPRSALRELQQEGHDESQLFPDAGHEGPTLPFADTLQSGGEPPSGLYDSFREMSGNPELRKLMSLMIFLLLNSSAESLEAKTDKETTEIYLVEEEKKKQKARKPILSLDPGFIYAISYGLREVAGIKYPDLSKDQREEFSFPFHGQSRRLRLDAKATQNDYFTRLTLLD